MTDPGFLHIAVILNPTAGADTALAFRKEVMDALMRGFPQADLTMLHTTNANDPARFGAEQNCDLLISVSGDGTVHGIVQGLMQRPSEARPVLGVIPVGSGNDIARTLGIGASPTKVVRSLVDGVVTSCDLGKIISNMPNAAIASGQGGAATNNQTVYFMQTLSFGMDAAVALKTMELRKKTKQRESVLYARAAVNAILTDLRANRLRFCLDGVSHDEELLIMAVQNGPTYGGGFKIAPSACVNDGLLNVVTGSKVSPPKALYYLNKLKSGKHLLYKPFNSYQVSKISIQSDKQLPAQVDGEMLLGTNFQVTVEQRALRVLVPQGSPVLATIDPA